MLDYCLLRECLSLKKCGELRKKYLSVPKSERELGQDIQEQTK